PDGGMRNIAVPTNFVGRIDDHHALGEIVGKDACRLAQQGRLADARPAHHQDAAPRLDDVANDGDRAEHGATHTAGDADDAAFAIADRRDAVQRALDPGAIVVTESTDALDDVLDVFFTYRVRRQQDLAPR